MSEGKYTFMRGVIAGSLVSFVLTVCLGLSYGRHERVSEAWTTPKLVLPAKITRVYDGYTLTAEFTMRARIRLIDCWAPELRDRGGPESRDNLKSLSEGKRCNVVIDLTDVDRLDDIFSFGRLLAHVVVNGKDLSVAQVESGHARRTKQ